MINTAPLVRYKSGLGIFDCISGEVTLSSGATSDVIVTLNSGDMYEIGSIGSSNSLLSKVTYAKLLSGTVLGRISYQNSSGVSISRSGDELRIRNDNAVTQTISYYFLKVR